MNKKSKMGLFEKIMGVHSQNEYRVGAGFSISEMTSQAQIKVYNNIVNELCISTEEILYFTFTIAFQERYNFAGIAAFQYRQQ